MKVVFWSWLSSWAGPAAAYWKGARAVRWEAGARAEGRLAAESGVEVSAGVEEGRRRRPRQGRPSERHSPPNNFQQRYTVRPAAPRRAPTTNPLPGPHRLCPLPQARTNLKKTNKMNHVLTRALQKEEQKEGKHDPDPR